MPLKRVLIAAAKIGISLAILGYLFSRALKDATFTELWEQPKRWDLLLAATVAAVVSVLITFVRWYLLVRAVHVQTSVKEAFRLGFLGYLFNFFSVGIIGGDVLKAVMLARHRPGQRAAIVASVVMDRVIGLYALFAVATVAFWFVDWQHLNVRNVEQFAAVTKVCQLCVWLTALGAAGLICVMIPAFTRGGLWPMIFRLPRVGQPIERLIEAVRLYQSQIGLIVVSLVMSFAVHALSTVSVYLAAMGLPGEEPSFGTHFVIVPISMVAGAAPLPGGLGAFEVALDFLYRAVSSVAIAERQGFVVALAYRVITLVIAAIGLGYYLTSRREVTSVMQEVEGEDSARGPQAPMRISQHATA